MVGGWPVGYLHNAVKELNAGLPRTNTDSSRVEDLSQRPPDFKSSALNRNSATLPPFWSPWKEIEYHYNHQLLSKNLFKSQIENYYVTDTTKITGNWIDSKANRRHQKYRLTSRPTEQEQHPNYINMPLVHQSTDDQTDKQTCRQKYKDTYFNHKANRIILENPRWLLFRPLTGVSANELHELTQWRYLLTRALRCAVVFSRNSTTLVILSSFSISSSVRKSSWWKNRKLSVLILVGQWRGVDAPSFLEVFFLKPETFSNCSFLF